MKLNSNKKNYYSQHPQKQLAIRCLTIPEKGYGNFSRCLNVAESLKKNNVKISFIVDYDKFIVGTLKKRHFDFICKKRNIKLKDEYKFISYFLKNNNIDTILIDMRDYGESLSKFLFDQGFNSIIFDDAWCKCVYADILFNGTNAKNYHSYQKINKNSKLFLDTKYWITNENFNKYRKKLSDIKSKRKYNVVISMGGADRNNLTSTILKSIIQIKFIKITIILGPLFSNFSDLKQLIKNNNKIKLIQSSNKIWKDLSCADIAICNGGNTLFELATLSVPTLSVPAFQHEIEYSNMFMSKNFSINLGFRQRNIKKINSELLNLLDDLSHRKKMCLNSKKIIDGKGLSRVVKIILKSLS